MLSDVQSSNKRKLKVLKVWLVQVLHFGKGKHNPKNRKSGNIQSYNNWKKYRYGGVDNYTTGSSKEEKTIRGST